MMLYRAPIITHCECRNPIVKQRAGNVKLGNPPSRSGFSLQAEYQSTAKKWQVVPAKTNRCQIKWW